MSEKSPKEVFQPIHPSIRSRLDPEYVAFHEEYLQYVPSSESVPWDPVCRSDPSPFATATSALLDVGGIRDFDYGGNEQIRIFTPAGEKPGNGWPALVWFHGGGWTMGGLSSENSFLTRLCANVKCVVVSVNYRHAPEHPYPAAINDCVDGYKWITSMAGQKELDIDISKIALGGLSAGGGLAAIVSLKTAFLALQSPIFQLLLLPVIDNTATVSTVWASNANAPWLTPARMTWYRNMYLPNKDDRTKWDVSPNFSPREILEKSPKSWIAASELDILCEEARLYSEKLKEAGIDTTFTIYSGSTHSLLILDGVLFIGRKLVNDATEALSKAFH